MLFTTNLNSYRDFVQSDLQCEFRIETVLHILQINTEFIENASNGDRISLGTKHIAQTRILAFLYLAIVTFDGLSLC